MGQFERQFGGRKDDEWQPGGTNRDTYQTPPPPAVTTVPSVTGAPDAPPDYGTFEMPTYGGAASPSYHFGQVPAFHAPQFGVPTFEDAQNTPGYQFRLDSGRQALERGAAARGTLRTGGTLKDVLEYGQKFGAEEYGNVFNRALQAFGTKYQGARDEYAPYLAQYQNQFGAEQARAMAEFNRQYEVYQSQLDAEKYKEALINGTLQQPVPTFPTGG